MKDKTKVLEEITLSRRTVHRYTDEKVPEAIIHQAIEHSLWVPNHKLTFPWAFKILRDEERLLLGRVAVEEKMKTSDLSDIKQKALNDKLAYTGSLILCCRKKTDEGDLQLVEEDRATIGCSIQAMSLFLIAEGYYSKWSTAKFLRTENFEKQFGLIDKNLECDGMLFCGKPDGDVPKPTDRPKLSDVLF